MFKGAGRFNKNQKLSRPSEFQQVFRSTCRSKDNYMLVIAKLNNLGQARLGLAVSRKNVKQATKRNRIKRIIRDSFRKNQSLLEGMDVVVSAQRYSGEANNKALNNSLIKHWQRIKECKKY